MCVYVFATAHLHVSAAHSYKRNSGVQKVLKSWGLARRLWLQLSPWQRQPVERLRLRVSFIIGRFTAFISSRANTSISQAQLMSFWSMGNIFYEWSKWGFKEVEYKRHGRCLESQTNLRERGKWHLSKAARLPRQEEVINVTTNVLRGIVHVEIGFVRWHFKESPEETTQIRVVRH